MHAALRSLPGGRGARWPRPSVGGVLLVLVIALGLGVAFAGGGYGPVGASVAVVGTILLAIAVAAIVAAGRGRMLPGGDAALGTLLLALFAVWALASTAWSVRPDRSLAWGALVAGYALAVLVAGAAARVTPRARTLAVALLLAGSVALSAVALVHRLSPDTAVTIGGLGNATRLRGPLDYWNALGLIAAIGALIAARQAVDRDRGLALRLGCGALVPPLSGVLLLSQSRGALVALAAGALVVAWSSSSGRLRLPALLAAGFVAAIPLAVTGSGRVEGTAVVPHSGRAAMIVALVATLALGGLLVLGLRWLERRVRWNARRTTRVVRVGSLAAVVLLVLAGGVYAVHEGGVGSALGDLRQRVVAADQVAPVAGADRLLSVSASNRAGWWAEAFGAWADRPIEGWGASSFGTIRKQYRQDATEVTQPHSLPLQVLAETGVVGLALLVAAFWLLLRAAVRRLRRMRQERVDPVQLGLQATLLGVTVAWLLQSSIDWPFDLPGVTIPVLAALAVASASPAPPRVTVATGEPVAPASVAELERQLARGPRPATRGLLLGTAVVLGVVLALATVMPVIGDRYATRAQDVLATEATPLQLRDATRDTAMAAGLDPFGLQPLDVGRQINQRRGNLLESRRLALREVARQPDNPQAWIAVAEVAELLADDAGMRRAATRAVELDPRGAQATTLLAEADGRSAPPAASPTATATPLPVARPAFPSATLP